MFWKKKIIEIPQSEIDELLSLMTREQKELFEHLHHRRFFKNHDAAFIIKILNNMYETNIKLHSGKTEREVLLEKFSQQIMDKILEIYDKYIKENK